MANTELSLQNPPESVASLHNLIKKNQETMLAALPKHLTPERFLRVTMTTIRRNPALAECTQESLLAAIVEASQVGLEIDGVLGHAYLVPFKNRRKINGNWVSIREATLIPGFRGLTKLVRNSGAVQSISSGVAYENDPLFEYQLGSNAFVRHQPSDAGPPVVKGPDGIEMVDHTKATHVYVVVKLTNGGEQISVWAREAVDVHKRRYSKAWRQAEEAPAWDKDAPPKRDSAWHTNWPEMARKTLIRDMIARGELPVSVEIQQFAMRDEVGPTQDTTFVAPKTVIEESSLAGITQALESEAKSPAAPEKGSREDFLLQVVKA